MRSQHSVSLPMYDFPAIRTATDAWWRGIAQHLQRAGVAAAHLSLLHDRPVRELWGDKQLLMSQCCGYDVVFGHRTVLAVLATPVYAVEGCRGGYYHSRIVVHQDSGLQALSALRGKVAAINGPESHSGMNALLSLVQPLSRAGYFFSQIKVSGAHVDSLALVQQRAVDVAAIDCVTYALLARYQPAAVTDLVTIARTERAPAVPYVTRQALDATQQQRLRAGLLAAFSDPALATVREALLLADVVVKPPEFYQSMVERFQFDPQLLAVMA